jgi:hypothetical protein
LFILIGVFYRINHIKATNTGNGPAKSEQLIPVKLIRPAKGMDYPRRGLFCIRVTHIVGQVVVLNNRTVFVFFF